jgi:hypothetical protein
MVGSMRSRVSVFMDRFRKLGFIPSSGGLRSSLQLDCWLLRSVLRN